VQSISVGSHIFSPGTPPDGSLGAATVAAGDPMRLAPGRGGAAAGASEERAGHEGRRYGCNEDVSLSPECTVRPQQ